MLCFVVKGLMRLSFLGAGPLLPDGDAGAFPVPVTGVAESPAGGTVLPGRGASAGSGETRKCPHTEHEPWAPDGAGGGRPLMEGSFRGTNITNQCTSNQPTCFSYVDPRYEKNSKRKTVDPLKKLL